MSTGLAALSTARPSYTDHTLDSFLDLRNQASVDATKLAKISDYEHRIKTLTKTLAVWYAPSSLPRPAFWVMLTRGLDS